MCPTISKVHRGRGLSLTPARPASQESRGLRVRAGGQLEDPAFPADSLPEHRLPKQENKPTGGKEKITKKKKTETKKPTQKNPTHQPTATRHRRKMDLPAPECEVENFL